MTELDTGEIVGGSKTADMGGTSVKTVVDTEADAAGGSGSVDVTVAADQGESADGDKTTDQPLLRVEVTPMSEADPQVKVKMRKERKHKYRRRHKSYRD